MILIPIIESVEEGERFDAEEVQRSIGQIIDATLDETMDEASRGPGRQVKNSQAIIRAFHERFCNIPPFCDRRRG